MVNVALVHMEVNMTGKGEHILIINCTFDHISTQIFDPKLEVIPQTKVSLSIHACAVYQLLPSVKHSREIGRA